MKSTISKEKLSEQHQAPAQRTDRGSQPNASHLANLLDTSPRQQAQAQAQAPLQRKETASSQTAPVQRFSMRRDAEEKRADVTSLGIRYHRNRMLNSLDAEEGGNDPQMDQVMDYLLHYASAEEELQRDAAAADGGDNVAAANAESQEHERAKLEELGKQTVAVIHLWFGQHADDAMPSKQDWDKWKTLNSVCKVLGGAEVQRKVPSVEAFKSKTNAGRFSRRGDTLKQIDSQLAECHYYMQSDVAFASTEWAKSDNPANRARAVKFDADLKKSFGKLNAVIEQWLAEFKNDETETTDGIRDAIEELQIDVQFQLSQSLEQRAGHALGREAVATEASKRLMTVDQLKEQAGSINASMVGQLRGVVRELATYHAIKDSLNDDEKTKDFKRWAKLAAIDRISEEAHEVGDSISRARAHAGYEKGNLGMVKENTNKIREALFKLYPQLTYQRGLLETADEKEARREAVDDMYRTDEFGSKYRRRSPLVRDTTDNDDWVEVADREPKKALEGPDSA